MTGKNTQLVIQHQMVSLENTYKEHNTDRENVKGERGREREKQLMKK